MISANISKQKRARIYARDGYRCALCDDPRHLQIHHVLTRGEGGPRDYEMNMIALCPRCHALCHGTDIDGVDIPGEQVEQAMTEYMADLYAERFGIVWNPWEQTPWEKQGKIGQRMGCRIYGREEG